jgi:prepilin-type processing-associated H-X9-DG protein
MGRPGLVAVVSRGTKGAVSRPRLVAWLAGLLFSVLAQAAAAQSFEVSPFYGYRFGGGLFEQVSATPVDVDGAPSYGVTLDLFVNDRSSVTFLFSRQQAQVPAAGLWTPGARYTTLSVDHWHVGGTQELEGSRIRPFIAGSVGLTRFGGPSGSEIRFSAEGGAGVKLMPSRHVGVRFDGRVYAVFLDGHVTGICGGGACALAVDVFAIWQAEFTAGVVVSF